MDKGWIKLHRSLVDSATWECLTHIQKSVFIELLLRVNWTEATWMCPKCGENVKIPVGGTVKSIKILATKMDVKRSTLYNCIYKLQNRGFIRAINGHNPDRCHTLYVIEKFHLFQHQSEDNDRSRADPGQNPDRNLELYKKKEDKKIRSSVNDEFLELADYFRSQMLNNDKEHSIATKWDDNKRCKWGSALELLHRIDKRSTQLIKDVIHFATHDDFWAANIQSPTKLRKQFDRLRQLMGSQPKGKELNWIE